MLLEQFGGANGELAAAMQYSIQGLNCDDPERKDLLMDIGTEELSHLEVVGALARLHLKPVKFKREEAEADPLIAIAIGAVSPFFSPDGRWIAFRGGGRISKIPVEGGNPFALAASSSLFTGGSWNEDGTLIVPLGAGAPMARMATRQRSAPERVNSALKLFWMACGTEDGFNLYAPNKETADALRQRGVNLTFRDYPGGHWWIVARRVLYEFAQVLFR